MIYFWRKHVPFDNKIAPLLVAKYNLIIEFGKMIKIFMWQGRGKHIKHVSTLRI